MASGHAYYPTKMTTEEVIELFQSGVYHADLDTGVIWNMKKEPKQVKKFRGGVRKGSSKKPIETVRLYHGKKHKAIGVARLVWIVATGRDIPEGFEIHHRNDNDTQHWFENLLCLHPRDHKKFHRPSRVEEPEDDF